MPGPWPALSRTVTDESPRLRGGSGHAPATQGRWPLLVS